MFKHQPALIIRLTFTFAVLSLLTSCSTPDEQKTLETTTHTMGNKLMVYNYLLDKPILNKIAVHTYPVAIDNNGKRMSWNALGGKSGGTLLDDTTTQCNKDCIDISTVNYVMSEAPCIWPYEPYYAVVGVCWNAANRGLYYTGKTVHKVKFYAVIESYFGTYGLDNGSTCFRNICKQGRKLYAWSKCMKSTQQNYPWQGKSQRKLTGKTVAVDPRIPLFEHYFGEQADQALKALDTNTRHARYLSDLFDLNIDEKLGTRFSHEKRAPLHAIRVQLARTLDNLQIQDDNHDLYLDQMNTAINKALKKFAIILNDDEYLRLLNASKDEVFDIRNRNATR